MERLLFFDVLLLLFLQLCPVLILSEYSYVFPDRFFINCGSDSSVTLGSRKFVGDTDKHPNNFWVGKSNSVKDSSNSADSSLYQTARIYRNNFSYKFWFNINETGTNVVRLHFFPFKSDQANLVDALFHVSASGKSLLSNFSVNKISSNPVIKDFLVPLNSTKFQINFIPAKRPSFAFVNAIEVFLIADLKGNRTLVDSVGYKSIYYDLASQVLRTVHRVNVGGPSLNDSTAIASEWLADENFLFVGNSTKNCGHYGGELKYSDNVGAMQNYIPELVYRTCKEVDLGNDGVSSSTNITWQFSVSKNTRHLVRVHFCDIVGSSINLFSFSLFIYSNFNRTVNPYPIADRTAVPFYYEFVVDSGDYDFISIIVVPMDDNQERKAYLNGVEIQEFITEQGLKLDLEEGSEHKKKLLRLIVISSVVGAFVVCSLIVVCFFYTKNRKTKRLDTVTSYGRPYVGTSTKSLKPPPVSNLNLKLKMPFAEIIEATNNFDVKLLIGEGGFGKVYKGTLRNGLKVAVKRGESKHGQGIPEFQTEVMVLSKIRHRHLVSLIGYCYEGSEMILVYEFMEKRTLRDHLYNLHGQPETPSALSLLNWKQRLEICLGAARGLHYLHTGLVGGIIHRDIKSTNILLDDQYVAKVADFGLSKSGDSDDQFSTGIKGSFGYLDPEYLTSFQFTEKSDVYSFGVVLLEVLCARPAIIMSQRKEEINLAEWGLLWLKKGELEKIMDPSMTDRINPNSLRKFSEIVEKCLKPTGANRPTMLDICWDLEYALQLQQTVVHREAHEDSTIDASMDLSSGPFLRLRSNNFPIEKDNVSWNDGSGASASGVFSQLRNDDGGR